MANTTTKRTKTTASSEADAIKNSEDTSTVGTQTTDSGANQNTATEDTSKTSAKKKRVTTRSFDMNDLVECQSCVYGNLIYVSKKTGYYIEWPEFGAIQTMTIDELITMRNSQPAFFKNGWIRVVGEDAREVSEYLHIDNYATSGIPFEDFDDIYKQSAEDIISTVSPLSDSLKESIARRAIDLIKEGTLDSNKKINAIETATGFDLSE